jgi:hypothetical protein
MENKQNSDTATAAAQQELLFYSLCDVGLADRRGDRDREPRGDREWRAGLRAGDTETRRRLGECDGFLSIQTTTTTRTTRSESISTSQ